MNVMVSARVPEELRDQVNEGLKEIGSSPTELINSAYEAFAKTKKLPNESPALRPGVRRLTKKQRDEFKAFVENTTLKIPKSFFGGKSYKELKRERLIEKYEALG